MQALFIGHPYTDVTFQAEYMPDGNEKSVATDYAFGIGGNAVVAAFCLAKISPSLAPDLLIPLADDWPSQIISEKAALAGISVLRRHVSRGSISFIHPHKGMRSVLRCRDTQYEKDFPKKDIKNYSLIHVDGHQSDVASYYAKKAKEAGVTVSLDGSSYNREGIKELLSYVDIAIVSELFQEELGLSVIECIDFLLEKGAKVAGITLGENGMVFKEAKGVLKTIKPFNVPANKIVDSSGAGDVFHGAYIYSYLTHKEKTWDDHFKFASAAAAYSLQFLGVENSLPNLFDIVKFAREHNS